MYVCVYEYILYMFNIIYREGERRRRGVKREREGDRERRRDLREIF